MALDAVSPRTIEYEILNPPPHEGEYARVVFFLNIFLELDKTAAPANRADYNAEFSRMWDIAHWHHPISFNVRHSVPFRELINSKTHLGIFSRI